MVLVGVGYAVWYSGGVGGSLAFWAEGPHVWKAGMMEVKRDQVESRQNKPDRLISVERRANTQSTYCPLVRLVRCPEAREAEASKGC